MASLIQWTDHHSIKTASGSIQPIMPRITHLDNLTKDLYSLNTILRLGNCVYPNYHIVKMLYKIYITCLFYCNKQRRTYAKTDFTLNRKNYDEEGMSY